jgi:hypothetical protein
MHFNTPKEFDIQHLYLPSKSRDCYPINTTFLTFAINMGTQFQTTPAQKSSHDDTVAQALEIARESPDGASDPTISAILENALSQIWARVQAQPNSYVMTRNEFAVFNFFQHLFEGDKDAIAARKRYWDSTA